MKIILYKNVSASNVVNKKLEIIEERNVFLKRETNFINPVILLSSLHEGVNYFGIPVLNKFYFLQSKEPINSSIVKCNLKLDPLRTFKDIILSTPINYLQKIQEGDYSELEGEVTSYKTEVTTLTSKTILEGKTYVLSSIGGGSSKWPFLEFTPFLVMKIKWG